MSPEQALALIRLAKGAFPATTMDEFTPDAWTLALEDDNFEDARDALKQLMREQTFIHVSDIVRRIKRIRAERLTEFGALPEPPRGLDDLAEQAWLRDLRRRIADGEHVERPELPPGVEKPDDIDFETVFRSVDDVVDAELADDQESA